MRPPGGAAPRSAQVGGTKFRRHCEPPGRENARAMTGSAQHSRATSTVIASAAKQSTSPRKERKSGLLRFARNDVDMVSHTAASSPRGALEALHLFSAQRGRGERRMPNAPAASCAIVVIERTRVTTSTPESPDVPARNGFTAYFVLSPAIGLFWHRHRRIWFCLSPVGPTNLRKLDADL